MQPTCRLASLSSLVLSILISHVSADSLFDARSPLPFPNNPVLEHSPAAFPNTECSKLRLTGPIETTQCDYEAVDSVNGELFSRLHELVETPFFRYFKVDLYRDCPFWVDDGLCMQRECGVTSLDESEVPKQWRAAELSRIHKESNNEVRLPGCYSRELDYCFLDDDDEGEYIDLAANQEGYTGYAGPKAHRVWKSVYEENCFGIQENHAGHERDVQTPRFDQSPTTAPSLESLEPPREECVEKRVYYKIISGLHASISTHICHLDLNKATGQWGPNLDCFAERIAAHPERLQYIYFNTVLLLRAVSRVGPFLSTYNFDGEQESKTNTLLTDVLDIAKVVGAFDEKALFTGNDAKVLKAEFRDRFRNVSRIMDCVGCDKCRLWGKVQVTGLAAAMKILFEMDDKALDPRLNQNLLSRWEVVALLNVLHRFSESLHATENFRRMWNERKAAEADTPSAPRARRDGDTTTSSGAQAPQKEGVLRAPKAKTLPPHSPSATSSQTAAATNTTIKAAVQIQSLGRNVYNACKRSTVGCLNVITTFAQAVLQRFADWDGRDRQMPSSDL